MEGEHRSLRLEKHSRGHVATCNGAVEQVHARVERADTPVACTVSEVVQ